MILTVFFCLYTGGKNSFKSNTFVFLKLLLWNERNYLFHLKTFLILIKYAYYIKYIIFF